VYPCMHSVRGVAVLQVVRRQQSRMRGQYNDEQDMHTELEEVAEQLQDADAQLKVLASSEFVTGNSQQHAEVLMSILDQVQILSSSDIIPLCTMPHPKQLCKTCMQAAMLPTTLSWVCLALLLQQAVAVCVP
jgi:hypothetical protein